MADTENNDLDIPAGWTDQAGKLHRHFEFDDFTQAFAFMTRVAAEAETLDHHPDWSNSWNTVDIDLVSHDAGGLTDADCQLARAIDAVVQP